MEFLDPAEQARACRKLLSAVIITAVRDACSTPPKRNKTRGEENRMPISTEAFTALRFLFDESVSGLNEYLNWFDIDPGQYRLRLQQTMADSSPLRLNGFEPLDRRNFRYNYGMWLRLKDQLPLVNLEGDEDE